MLNTYQECADKLAELLAAAQSAVHNEDKAAMRQAMDDLNDFIDICGSPIKAQELDQIASQAAGGIFAAGINLAQQELSNRTSELASLTKEVNAIGDHMNEAGSAMRLEKARAVTDAASGALDAVNSLKQQLNTSKPDKDKVADNINSLVQSLQSIYDMAGNLKN